MSFTYQAKKLAFVFPGVTYNKMSAGNLLNLGTFEMSTNMVSPITLDATQQLLSGEQCWTPTASVVVDSTGQAVAGGITGSPAVVTVTNALGFTNNGVQVTIQGSALKAGVTYRLMVTYNTTSGSVKRNDMALLVQVSY